MIHDLDLFAARAKASSAPLLPPPASIAVPPAAAAVPPGCHSCPFWTVRGQVAMTSGDCAGKIHGGALSSYLYICPDHPAWASRAPDLPRVVPAA